MKKTCSVLDTGQVCPTFLREHQKSARENHQRRIKRTTGLAVPPQPEPPPARVNTATLQQCCEGEKKKEIGAINWPTRLFCAKVQHFQREMIPRIEPRAVKLFENDSPARICEVLQLNTSTAASEGRSGFTCMLLICVQNGFGMGNGLQTGKPGCVNTKRGIQAASEWPQHDTIYAHARKSRPLFFSYRPISQFESLKAIEGAGAGFCFFFLLFFFFFLHVYVGFSWDS